jgi:hypothetical protein
VQLAADIRSSASAAHVEVAARVVTADRANVPVTGYLTLRRTASGWLVDSVLSWN